MKGKLRMFSWDEADWPIPNVEGEGKDTGVYSQPRYKNANAKGNYPHPEYDKFSPKITGKYDDAMKSLYKRIEKAAKDRGILSKRFKEKYPIDKTIKDIELLGEMALEAQIVASVKTPADRAADTPTGTLGRI